MESVESIRGGELKIVEGFVYVKIKKHNLAGGWCAFECEKRHRAPCIIFSSALLYSASVPAALLMCFSPRI